MDRTDAELISASLADPSLFGTLFERHYQAVYRFAARRNGVEDAGDVTADTFVRAFEIRHRYDPTRNSCLPWLYGIAQNLIGDRIRRVRRGRRIYLVAAADIRTVEFEHDADSRILAASVGGQLNDALRRLSNRDRNTLLLYALEGLTYSEIALTLDIPVGTVGSRLARARERISELIPDLAQRTRSKTQDIEDEPDE